MKDNDIFIYEQAKDSAFELDVQLRIAIMDADLETVTELKPRVDEAYDKLGVARIKLLEEGVIATDEDVGKMLAIREEIDEAASTQQMIEAAIKLIALLIKFI